MVSLQILNALLNVFLWALAGIVGRVIESIYVSASKLQLKFSGKTKATDSSETDIFQWLPGRTGVFGHTRGPETRLTAKWVFSLLVFSVLFLPAELYVETGIDERRDCSPTDVLQKGLCASPWHGHSDVGIASSALLVQEFTWIDQNWNIVYEGASPLMVAEEVHVEVNGEYGESEIPRKVLASNCRVSVSSCTQCGTMTVEKDDGAFDTIITHASLATADLSSIKEGKVRRRCPFFSDNLSPVPTFRGDLTYDYVTGLAFFFWALPCDEVPSKSNSTIFQLKARGVETLLSDAEVDQTLLGRRKPWNISLSTTRTRVYDITCNSPGLGWKDLTRAVSLYRTVQMEKPGLQRTNVSGNLSRVPPLSSSGVLKALFAMKAEDVRSETCLRYVPVYQECGSFVWSRAWIYIGLCLASIVIWVVLRITLGGDWEIDFPHNTASWRHMATRGKAQGDIELMMRGDSGVFVTLSERLKE